MIGFQNLKTEFLKKTKMISKEVFCTIIENLRQQIYMDRKYGEYIQEMFGSGSRCSYKDNLAIKSILILLHIHFPKDENGFSEIEHYCFILEFGKIDSENLITAEELYDGLISNKK